MDGRRRILFAGYARVHFLCFLPVYERLRKAADVDLWLSGGFRHKQPDGEKLYEIAGFYDPFEVPRDRVIPFDSARRQVFDVTVCAHTSDTLLPEQPGKTVQIFHGVSFKNFAVREKVLCYDYLCLAGRYHGERFRERGLIRVGAAACLITGFPKVDRLVASDFDREGLLRAAGLDPALPTILYAPTGGKHNSLETIGEEVVSAIGDDGRWNLLVKPHDHPKRQINWFERLAPRENDRVRSVRSLDVIDYMKAADLLLTDASSVAVEYTLLDRPIVFIDVPKLLKNVLERGAPLDLSTYGRKIGRIARTPQEVVAAIGAGLREPSRESELRRAMAREVFHDPGGATGRVAEVIRWAAGLRAEPPVDAELLRPQTNRL